MNDTIKYKVGIIWFSLILIVGIVLLGLSIFDLSYKGISLTNILTAILGSISLYQAWSYSKWGYVIFDDQQLSINLGVRKKQFKVSEIKEIKNFKNSFKIILKNGRKAYIGMGFVSAKDRAGLFQEMERIKTLHNIVYSS